MGDIRVQEHAHRLRDRVINSTALAGDTPMVKVYAFEAYDPLRDGPVRAPCKMTERDIESWRGVLIHGTEEEVPANRLDDNGRYYPGDCTS